MHIFIELVCVYCQCLKLLIISSLMACTAFGADCAHKSVQSALYTHIYIACGNINIVEKRVKRTCDVH